MTSPDRGIWSRSQSYTAMTSAPEEDFSNFLDLDNIDLNFPILDGNDVSVADGAQQHGRRQAHAFAKSPFPQQDQYSGPDEGGEQQRWLRREHSAPKRFPERLSTGAFDYRQDENWINDPNFQQHFSVPPTPNSSEMYPAQYVQQQLFEHSQRYHQYRKDDGMANFTPHESPQFVGSEGTFAMPDFADPGTFNLDPLTSPAMNPQPTSAQVAMNMQSRTAESSLNGSPGNGDMDEGSLSSSMDRPRKTRKRAIPSKSAPTSAGPRPLTSTASRKRKGSVNTRNSTRNSVDSAAKALDSTLPSNHRPSILSTERNGTNSTSSSPQLQGEVSMAPPPKPGSLKSTPTLRPQATSNPDGFPPATPASLMRLQHQVGNEASGTPSPATNGDQQQGAMEELILPEAAAPAESMAQATKRLQLRSLQSTPLQTTNPPSGPAGIITSPAKANNGQVKGGQARNSRKRNSNASNLVSPALRPRISPSIKPLLPDGAQHSISDETHALLLASKSNYQNLLEGNHLPGVNYPSELSTNLTSKRTSHKIAEQGRRNRINTALQEMQTLLPTMPGLTGAAAGSSPHGGTDLNTSADDDIGSKTPLTPTQAANSKAATVELAIDYIKKLNSRLAEKESENESLRKEMAALKAKLED